MKKKDKYLQLKKVILGFGLITGSLGVQHLANQIFLEHIKAKEEVPVEPTREELEKEGYLETNHRYNEEAYDVVMIKNDGKIRKVENEDGTISILLPSNSEYLTFYRPKEKALTK